MVYTKIIQQFKGQKPCQLNDRNVNSSFKIWWHYLIKVIFLNRISDIFTNPILYKQLGWHTMIYVKHWGMFQLFVWDI